MTRQQVARELFTAGVQLASALIPLLVAWWLFVLDADDRADRLEQLSETAAGVRARVARARELVPAGFVDEYRDSPALAFARSRLEEMEREEEAET